MCGIFGQYALFPSARIDAAVVEHMAQLLAHRGPDGVGIHRGERLIFGAGRLAIIDLSAPPGPIFNEDGRIGLVFNGEIYNYRALRLELECAGHHFQTATDTEVIVHGYEQWGADVLQRLNGMFALCIHDSREERLLLARDRGGEKPLYFAQAGDTFMFASEIKALFASPELKPCLNAAAVPLYLSLGYVPPPQTLFEGIEKVAPGEYVIVRPGAAPERGRYWQAQMDAGRSDQRYDDAVRRVRAAVTEAVQSRMISDVPVGAFLSGGLDSTSVVALMAREAGQPVHTFTVGYDFAGDEKADRKFNADVRYARLAADACKTDHHVITVRADERLMNLLPRMIWHMDEPVSQPSIIQTAFVAALARQCGVPVLLSGDAGDELFAGYAHYRTDRLVQRYQAVPAALRQPLIDPLLRRSDGGRRLVDKSHITAPAERYLAWMRMIDPKRLPELLAAPDMAGRAGVDVAAVLDPLLARPHTRHFADRIAYTSFALWVAEDSNMRVDKMSMAASVEARAPLEDHRLVELAFHLPLAYKLRRRGFKTVFKDAMADLLPAEILTRSKWGFVPPTSNWLRTVFRPLVDTYLSEERLRAGGLFNSQAVRQIVDAHLAHERYELWTIWPILVLQLWLALYIDGDLHAEPLTAGALTEAATLP